jgi:hypothetical protein
VFKKFTKNMVKRYFKNVREKLDAVEENEKIITLTNEPQSASAEPQSAGIRP